MLASGYYITPAASLSLDTPLSTILSFHLPTDLHSKCLSELSEDKVSHHARVAVTPSAWRRARGKCSAHLHHYYFVNFPH